MNKEVTGCEDCPMCGEAYLAGLCCNHPEAVQYVIEELNGKLVTPEYCPLKFETITISIKKD